MLKQDGCDMIAFPLKSKRGMKLHVTKVKLPRAEEEFIVQGVLCSIPNQIAHFCLQLPVLWIYAHHVVVI
jgi:hypothetical protein